MRFGVAVHVDLTDPLDSEFFMLQRDLIGTRCKLAGILLDLLRKGRREEDVLWVEGSDKPGDRSARGAEAGKDQIQLTFGRVHTVLRALAGPACCLLHRGRIP